MVGAQAKKRKSPIYAFFNANPNVEFANDGMAEYLVFHCSTCRVPIKQGLKTSDKASTGTLIQHAKSCWGDKAVSAVQQSKSIDKARDALKNSERKVKVNLPLLFVLSRDGPSHFQHSRPQRNLYARWVSESARPFHVVQDHCYRWLQKEGRPEHYIPSRETVSRDVKKLYNYTKEKLSSELQVSIMLNQ
ncbi:hypothetical protein BT96DRAFT_837084 [Gymnopus androsaceus JB14]|uniref:BED-type domain-containing protein n=1 Tax=Gymnopus androsaceus JB14 TaxID=1447944 RepID=A0A6A4GR15_9AGAR|nr:hypothetical protein BT96DRAFT_837084 [Gymnopus androsaceus JB14]